MTRTGARTIELREVSHGPAATAAAPAAPLRALSFALEGGVFTVVRGDTASGAATLLRLLGLFEAPTEGEILVEGQGTRGWSEEQRLEYRAHQVGQLLAAPFLLPSLTAAENIAMPLFKLSGLTAEDAVQRAEMLLAFAGLTAQGQTAAGELSAEDQYGVALARALAHAPRLLLVEELDAALAGEALGRLAALLREAAERFGVTVVATASRTFPAELAHRVLELTGGQLQSETALPHLPLT